ncbi:hypothetical protein CYMTET_28348, partial [Cymbomonas tetramitiformis]
MIGTLCLREANEIHVIDYDAESEAVKCVNLIPHQHEIWHLAPCPFDPVKLFTCYNTGSNYMSTLWEASPADSGKGSLKELTTLEGLKTPIRSMLWSPKDAPAVLSVEEEALRTWSLDGSRAVATASSQQAEELQHGLWAAAWDPHDLNAVATVSGNSLAFWDLRTMQRSQSVEQAHSNALRDVDFNPKHENHL